VGYTVPISVESVANIRFAGSARFRMSYQYSQINGQSTLGSVSVIASTAR
jgi:hypothetical protein